MTRDEFIEQAKTKLDKWNDKVEEYEARAASLKEEARADYKKALAETREHVAHAEKQLEKARDVGAEAWNDTKATFENAWKAEKESVEKSFEQIRA